MEVKKPHVLCFPAPSQGNICPMMQLAKVLHSRGFFVTFVNTNFTHKRLLKSGGLESLEGFCFESIDDGLSPDVKEVMEDVEGFCKTTREKCVEPLRDLLMQLQKGSDGRPPLTCIVSDGFMTFTLEVAKEMGIPDYIFFPSAACAFMAFLSYPELIRRGFVPLKDESYISNGYLNSIVDWIPGMKEMQLRDLGSFVATTDANNYLFNMVANEVQNNTKASAIIFNTFDSLEHHVLEAIRSLSLSIYTIGPLPLQCSSLPNNQVKSVQSSLWAEQRECIKWLDNFKAGSIIYVNFGSTTIMTAQQLIEFAWGLANSKHPFLWIIRPDLVINGQTNLPREILNEIEGRSMLVSWCPQVEVLSHPSIAVFLTHCGWNSTLESIAHGVPMLCWPFWGDQQIDCRYACKEWSVGMEISNNATREEIGLLIKEFMEGEKGKEMRENAMKWKKCAEVAIKAGSSHMNLELIIHDILQARDD